MEVFRILDEAFTATCRTKQKLDPVVNISMFRLRRDRHAAHRVFREVAAMLMQCSAFPFSRFPQSTRVSLGTSSSSSSNRSSG